MKEEEDLEGESKDRRADKKQDKDNTPVSYLMDKTNDFVKESDGETIRYTYAGDYESKGETWDLWKGVDDDQHQMILMEDEEGLYTGYPSLESYIDIEYPIEKGKTFGDDYIGRFTITDVDITVTTKAGTFNNVVEVFHEGGWTVYHAPNVGHIKSIDEHGETVIELIEILPPNAPVETEEKKAGVEQEVDENDHNVKESTDDTSYDPDDYRQYLGKWKSESHIDDSYYQIELEQQGDIIHVIFFVKEVGEEVGHEIQTKLTVDELTGEFGGSVEYDEDKFGEAGGLEIQLTEQGLYIVDYNSQPKRAPQRLYDEYYFSNKVE